MARKPSSVSNVDFIMLNELFDKLNAEVITFSRKRPNDVVSAYKMKLIKKVLDPMYEVLKKESYGNFLEIIEITDDFSMFSEEITYSDLAFLFGLYRAAIQDHNE